VSLVKAAVGPPLQVVQSFSGSGNRDYSRASSRARVRQCRYVLSSESDGVHSECDCSPPVIC